MIVYADFRRAWVWILASIVISILGVICYPTTHLESPSFGRILTLLLRPVACWIIIWNIVQDRLTGLAGASYFRRNLLSAFPSIFLFINVPLFASHLVLLNKLGIFPDGWLGALLWRQLFFSAYFVLPVFGLRLAARSGKQMAITATALLAGLATAKKVLHLQIWNAEATEWIRWSAGLLIILLGFAALILMRRAGDRPFPRLLVLSAASVLCWLALHGETWRTYFALQESASRESFGPAVVGVEFDRSRAGSKPKETPPGNPVEVAIPVRIFGIPEGLEAEEYRSSFSLEGKSGVWHSGLLNGWAIRGMHGAEPWLVLGVDPDFYRLNARSPVKLHLDCTFTLMRRLRSQVRVNGNVADIAGFGQCRTARTSTGGNVTDCFSPAFRSRIWDNTISVAFPAVPVVPSFDAVYASNESYDWAAPNLREITIEARFARIRRQFAVSNIRLADYEVTSPRYEGGPVDF